MDKAIAQTPLVSVIIPTYNRREYVQLAIDSVLAQTYTNYEIIAVDDGSTDGTGEALQRRYGNRIHYVWQENHGESVARNRAIEMASGEYIALLDSDDIWLPDKLARQAPVMNSNSSVGMVFCLAWLINSRGQRIADAVLAQDLGDAYVTPEMLCFQNYICASTTLIRKSILLAAGGFDSTIRFGEDWDLWLRIALRSSVFCLAQPLACIRRHRNTQCYFPSAEYNARVLSDHLQILSKAFSSFPHLVSEDQKKRAIAHQYLLAGLAEYAVNRPNDARDYWRSASELDEQALANRPELVQWIVNYALKVAEGETGVEHQRAYGYVSVVFAEPQLLAQKALYRVTRGNLDAVLGFMQYQRQNLPAMRYHFLRALRWDITWIRNRGIMSLLFESVVGPRWNERIRRIRKNFVRIIQAGLRPAAGSGQK